MRTCIIVAAFLSTVCYAQPAAPESSSTPSSSLTSGTTTGAEPNTSNVASAIATSSEDTDITYIHPTKTIYDYDFYTVYASSATKPKEFNETHGWRILTVFALVIAVFACFIARAARGRERITQTAAKEGSNEQNANGVELDTAPNPGTAWRGQSNGIVGRRNLWTVLGNGRIA